MPRFSIKDLLLAMLLVGVGLSTELVILNSVAGPMPMGIPIFVSFLCYLAVFGTGGALIGAGLLAPFHRKAVGLAIGFVFASSFFFFCALISV
jgi:hypothetical protein